MNSQLHPRLSALEKEFAPSTLTRINEPEFSRRQVELWIKRDDQLHPVISGNKRRKLKYPLNHLLYSGAGNIVSMGGRYSNHLHALAFAGKSLGIGSSAFIRGERPDSLTPTLRDIQNWGMKLQFVSRHNYRQLRKFKAHDSLPGLKANDYWLPEGGATDLALKGVAETLDEIDFGYDILAVACGTGTTMAGLIANAPQTSRVLGVATLNNAGFLVYDVLQLLGVNTICCDNNNWQIAFDYHFGGFAKTTPELLAFIREFSVKHHILLDQVYTGKLMYAVYDLLRQGYFMPGQRIVAIHTGGLQGRLPAL